jgi:hypothetical protein
MGSAVDGPEEFDKRINGKGCRRSRKIRVTTKENMVSGSDDC